jgi:hypothetical protein
MYEAIRPIVCSYASKYVQIIQEDASCPENDDIVDNAPIQSSCS